MSFAASPARDESSLVIRGAAVSLAAALASACLAPSLFWLLLGAAVTAGIALLALRHTQVFCVGWLVVTGCSLEMAASNLIGITAFQPTIAAVKAIGISLAICSALRWGPRLDPLNPAWGICAIAVFGTAHGLHRDLGATDSLRSLVGSLAPFAFFFCRTPPAWSAAIIRATAWAPMIAVAGGGVLAAAGIRPLFVQGGGLRLAGLGHPAFLAGVCLAALYACLITVFRSGRRSDLVLLVANGLILLLTGARAPLACGAAVTALSLVFVRSAAFPARLRVLLALAAGLAVAVLSAVMLLFDGELTSVRLFHLLAEDAVNLSGRDLLWPVFEQAAAESPWFGWGIGAGNVILPSDSRLATMLQTWAAHNEYLRLQVEGGYVGLGLLVTLFAAWVWRRTAPLRASDRLVMRFAFVALACHAFTDNVLISTPACVLFAFAAAVFASRPSSLPDSRPMA
jgi:O-antigen ligase